MTTKNEDPFAALDKILPPHKQHQQEPERKEEEEKGEKEEKKEEKKEEGEEEKKKLSANDFTFEDEEEEEEEDDKKKKASKSKSDSVAELRKAKDAIESELVAFKEAAGTLDPSTLKEISSFLSESEDFTNEGLIAQLQEAKEIKETLKEYEEKLKDREKKIAELDIRSSHEFNQQYMQPLQERATDLHSEIAQVSGDDSIVAPIATQKLHQLLMKDEKIDAIKLKGIMARFSEEFKAESGEEYRQPSITSVMTSLRSFRKANHDMAKAYQNWDSQKQEAAKKSQAQQRIEQELAVKEGKSERKKAAIIGMRTFDFDLVDGIASKADLQKEFSEAYKDQEQYFDDPTKTPPYEELMQRVVKARMFDDLANKYKAAMEELQAYKDEENGGSKDRGSKLKNEQTSGDDWLPSNILKPHG